MRIFLSILSLSLCLAGNAAAVALCGDDVDGSDVPCSCGDIVVSDVVLGDLDPVVSEVCGGDGLLIRAASLEVITIDLAGRTLRGAGKGHGLVVIFGGDRGARVISSQGRAVLSGFDSGVVASGADLQLLAGIDVRDVIRDGVRVRGPGLVVRDVTVTDAGRDGFAFSGRLYRSIDNRSESSGRHGFMLMGHEGGLSGANKASGSGGSGILVTGGGHWIEDCHAQGNGKSGIDLVASSVSIDRCVAEGNLESGIGGHGAHFRLAHNIAELNGGDGINLRGSAMIDVGGNRGFSNGYRSDKPVEQCSIGGTPCRTEEAP